MVESNDASGKGSGKSSGKSSGKRIGRAATRVLDAIKTNPNITIPEIAAQFGVSERAVEKQIRTLREAEVIARIGPAKGGHWEVFE